MQNYIVKTLILENNGRFFFFFLLLYFLWENLNVWTALHLTRDDNNRQHSCKKKKYSVVEWEVGSAIFAKKFSEVKAAINREQSVSWVQ